MRGQRQQNQPGQEGLAFPAESRSDALKSVEQGTETRMAKRRAESLAETERWMEEVCERETASRHYNESRQKKGVREWMG